MLWLVVGDWPLHMYAGMRAKLPGQGEFWGAVPDCVLPTSSFSAAVQWCCKAALHNQHSGGLHVCKSGGQMQLAEGSQKPFFWLVLDPISTPGNAAHSVMESLSCVQAHSNCS